LRFNMRFVGQDNPRYKLSYITYPRGQWDSRFIPTETTFQLPPPTSKDKEFDQSFTANVVLRPGYSMRGTLTALDCNKACDECTKGFNLDTSSTPTEPPSNLPIFGTPEGQPSRLPPSVVPPNPPILAAPVICLPSYKLYDAAYLPIVVQRDPQVAYYYVHRYINGVLVSTLPDIGRRDFNSEMAVPVPACTNGNVCELVRVSLSGDALLEAHTLFMLGYTIGYSVTAERENPQASSGVTYGGYWIPDPSACPIPIDFPGW
jgi:hypothetical protein